jgi:hypothetical protein
MAILRLFCDLLEVVTVETPGYLFGQLRRGSQVDLGGMDIHMSQIGRQPRQARVYIRAVPVPGQQPVNGKGVSQVMNAGAGVLAVGNGAPAQQLPKGVVDRDMMQAPGSLV